MKKIFLGGTCNGSTWRSELIPELEKQGLEYFDPVVEDWDAAAQKKEEEEKELCDIHLYVITSEMKGVFSIAEAVASANTPGKFSLMVIMVDGMDKSQLHSLLAVKKLMNGQKNGAAVDIVWHDKWGLICATTIKGGDVNGKVIKAVKPTLSELAITDRDLDEYWRFVLNMDDGSKIVYRGSEIGIVSELPGKEYGS